MTTEQINSLGLDIDTEDSRAVLSVEAAIEWLAENTTIDTTALDKLPARAKLFISKFSEINNLQSGVASESIEGLSQSFSSEKRESMIWDIANSLLGDCIKCRVRFVSAKRKWC